MVKPIGEIIEVTSTGFVAQCFDASAGAELAFRQPPSVGSFVKIGAAPPVEPSSPLEMAKPGDDEPDPFIASAPRHLQVLDQSMAPDLQFALVAFAQTTSLSPGRRPTALGVESDEEMRMQYPQVFELLTTEFTGMLIGYTDHVGRIRRHLPPKLPRIHMHVRICSDDEIASITANLSFLRFVLAMGQGTGGTVPPDALIAACLRHAFEARGGDIDFIENAGRTLLPQLGDDYHRLKGIIASALDGAN